MLISTWQLHLSNLQGVGPCGPSPFLLFTLDYLSEHSHSQTGLILPMANNLLLIAFCSLFVSMVDQAQMCPHPSHH